MDLRNRVLNRSTPESKQTLLGIIKTLEAESLSKTEFIANLIHDIHSPLRGIVGLASHVKEIPIRKET